MEILGHKIDKMHYTGFSEVLLLVDQIPWLADTNHYSVERISDDDI